MNVVRALLGGFLVTALAVACGSDSKGDTTSNNSSAVKCIGGSSATDACQSCEQSKCSSELHKCYGSDLKSGACKSLVACLDDASDPCKADCSPDSDCQSCISDDLMPCLQQNCSDKCTLPSVADAGGSGPPFGKATCADLAPCCGIITFASAKTGCNELVTQGNETNCASYYESLRAFCD